MNDPVVRKIQVGMLGTNCYIVMDPASKEGYIIDPGSDARKILEAARSIGLSCKGVLCTHGHIDHVGAVGKVAAALDSDVYISEGDSGVLTGSTLGAKLGGLLVSKPRGVEYLHAGEHLHMGDVLLKVLSTPGHSRGSMSFLCGDDFFGGDLVFEGSIGRTDLSGGSLSDLLESVRREVFVLDDDTLIHPGHGPDTTVGREKAHNPYLRELED
jgi:hydroxyacylglutathione hydrolase